MGKHDRISYIENYFSVLLTAAEVSDNIFVGTLPLVTDSGWEDMAYIEVQKMTDYDAYSDGSVLIYLYAKPTGSGSTLRKNVTRLNQMERALDTAVEEARDDDYIIVEQWRDSGFDDDRNFHYNVISVSVTVR